MAAGFLVGSQCIVNKTAAASAYINEFDFPRPLSNVVTTNNGFEVLSALTVPPTGNTFTYSSIRSDSNASFVANKVITMVVCDTANFSESSYSYSDAAAMWGFAFTSVFTFWLISKNIGLVLNAIRRF